VSLEDWELCRERAVAVATYNPGGDDHLDYPGPEDFTFGAIIGVVQLVAVWRGYPSRWSAVGAFHWVLKSPDVIDPPIYCRGQQGLFVPKL